MFQAGRAGAGADGKGGETHFLYAPQKCVCPLKPSLSPKPVPLSPVRLIRRLEFCTSAGSRFTTKSVEPPAAACLSTRCSIHSCYDIGNRGCSLEPLSNVIGCREFIVGTSWEGKNYQPTNPI